MKPRFDELIHEFAEGMASARQDVRYADVLLLHSSVSIRDQASRIKSSVLVYLAASFERFLTALVQRLNLALTEKRSAHHELVPSLLSLALYSKFDSLKIVDGVKSWDKRVDLLRAISSAELVEFSPSVSIFGAKTPRRKHLLLLWDIYGFKSNVAPSMAHLLALDSVADSRNEIAHGEVSPTRAGRKKTTADLKNLIDKLEELGLHLACSFEAYLDVDGHKK